MPTPQPPPEVIWQPNPGPQTRFLSSRAKEVLYGGAAGGGKSAALFALPLRWIHNPHYRGLYLRREAQYLGDAIDKTERLYPQLGARLVKTPRIVWTFPSGATLWMNHCADESDVANYDSFEFSEILFDELTHFTEKQYRGIRARLRGTDKALPYWSRAATNPGGTGHAWVFKRFAAWLDPAHPAPAAPGEARWYLGDEAVEPDTPDSLSRTFIPAKLADNPKLGPEYRAQLAQLDPVRRAQLEKGDWLKRALPKELWDRTRVTHVDRTPGDVVERVRCWDLAGSTRKKSPFTTAARLAKLRSGVLVLEHVLRFRGEPERVHAEFAKVADADAEFDERLTQWLPQDPGQAGKDQVRLFQLENPKRRIRWRTVSGDKLTRFGLASTRGLNGTLLVVTGSWNDPMHEELEAIPENEFWDQADAVSEGVAVLTGNVPADQGALDRYRDRLPKPRM